MKADTTSREFFDAKYRHQIDPWGFASSPYEIARYQTTLSALAHSTYARALEPGCSIGVLTAQLATFCESLHAMDISPTAVEQARERCRHLPNVEITCGALPGDLPGGSFDLIVLSEVGYYLDEVALHSLGRTLVHKLSEGGVLLAVHWLGNSEDHVLTGDRVHEVLGALDGLVHQHGERYTGYRLDRWIRG